MIRLEGGEVVEDQIETVAGRTLLIDVDTKLSDFSNREYFPHVPHYITAPRPACWRTKGVHIIYTRLELASACM